MDVFMTIVVSLIGGGLAGALINIWHQEHLKTEARKETLRALHDEAKLNIGYAEHNARMAATYAFMPQPLHYLSPRIFLPFRTAACERLLFSGAFKINGETRVVAADYLTSLDHVNTMIRRAEVEAAPDLNFSIHGIQRYCSGKLDPTTDAGATSVPENINRLLSHLESKYRAELGPNGGLPGSRV